jgi:pyrimidine-specific ribonucleoside hydrolase
MTVRWTCAGLMALMIMTTAPTPATAQDVTTVIVDTDAGTDDFMALAFLLSTPRARVEAVTITTGLAHAKAGATNVLRLLQLAGRTDVPVYVGRETPLRGDREFPADWRQLSDELPGVDLPQAKRSVEARPAHEFLAERLADASRPVTVLAIGGLTNLAEAFRLNPTAAKSVERLVIMGGAFKVPGNLVEGGVTSNMTAEWNFYIDPEAARWVFASGASIRLIPLDATQKVAVDRNMVRTLQTVGQRPMTRFVLQVLATVDDMIERGTFFAWDPLAAAVLVDPPMARFTRMAVDIAQDPPDEGRTTVAARGPSNADVAVEANSRRFIDLYTRTLGAVPRIN